MEHHNDLIAKARALEAQQNYAEAAPLYEKVIAEDVLNEGAINRLLVIYRKLKEYKKEIRLLNASIRAADGKAKQQQSEWGKKHPKAAKASKALLQSLTTTRTKSFVNYEEPVVTTWKKRRENLQKKVKA